MSYAPYLSAGPPIAQRCARAQPLPLAVPVPSTVTDEPPDPLIGATVECEGAGCEDAAGGVLLLAGGVDAAPLLLVLLLWVTVAALWAGLLLVFLTAWC